MAEVFQVGIKLKCEEEYSHSVGKLRRVRFISFLFVSFISAELLAPCFVGMFRKVTKAVSKYISEYSFEFV